MSLYASAASQEQLNADPREPHRSGVILGLRPLARPLVPVTLALMAGIAAPAWGLRLPEPWLLAAHSCSCAPFLMGGRGDYPYIKNFSQSYRSPLATKT